MAEEDEIDILGDFNLDNLLSKNESGIYDHSSINSQSSGLLSCDCTSQWLVEHTSANSACWYNNGNADFCSDLPQGNSQTTNFEHNVNHGLPRENLITDESGWTENQKNLLERGIEIFGRSSARLAQFIGTKTASDVKYYLKHFYSNIQLACRGINGDVIAGESAPIERMTHNAAFYEVLDDSEIPATIEEVIAAVTTAIPTIPVTKRRTKKSSTSKSSEDEYHYNDLPSGHSLLKSNVYRNTVEGAHPEKYKNKLDHLYQRRDKKHIKSCSKMKPKCKAQVKFKFTTLMSSSKPKGNKKKPRKPKLKTEIDTFSVGCNYISKLENKLVYPTLEGEEVVKIKKESLSNDSESDIEIDVENDISDNSVQLTRPIKLENFSDNCVKLTSPVKLENSTTVSNSKENTIYQIESDSKDFAKTLNDSNDKPNNIELTNLDSTIVEQLTNMDLPMEVVVMDESSITDLEKFVHSEFFEGRPTKTPERYLKIRNHMLRVWFNSAPDYVTKTSTRQGLKNCGDVNCIGRIHNFLEQIGAINFGCPQVSYVRPLYDMVVASVSPPKEKLTKNISTTAPRPVSLNRIRLKKNLNSEGEGGCTLTHDEKGDVVASMSAAKEKVTKNTTMAAPSPISMSRIRIKKKLNSDGEGGCTLTHDEKGDVINTIVVNEERVSKQRSMVKRPTVRLIYCKPFTEQHPQEYSIQLYLSELLLMDLHAHISHTEVMGLIGGHWSPTNKTLKIKRYEPCRNIAPSVIHCEMCPLSQAKAADRIHNEGLTILGWFHSHPTFAPEPSQQDLNTQLSVQQWIGNDKPCIGLILSPFSGALIASPYRCMIVDKKNNFEDQYAPYKFKVDVVSANLDVGSLLNYAWRIFRVDCNVPKPNRVNFNKPYFLDESITYLDKFISSIKMHLAKCTDVNKITCDAIIRGLTDICYKDL